MYIKTTPPKTKMMKANRGFVNFNPQCGLFGNVARLFHKISRGCGAIVNTQ